jgi:hypothetical protein
MSGRPALNDEARRNLVMVYESQALAVGGTCGTPMGVDHARCIVDGAMNAIIRMEGAEKAAAFAFGVADRVAGGLRAPTAIFPASAPLSLSAPAEADATDEAEVLIEEALADTMPAAVRSIPPWVYHCAIIIAMCIGFMAGQGWPR